MRWWTSIALAALAFASGTASGQANGNAQGARPACVTADGQAFLQAIGYRHSVHVANQCPYAVDCHVFTDVNPEVQNVHVEAGASTDVPTYLSSPARVFVAHADCTRS